MTDLSNLIRASAVALWGQETGNAHRVATIVVEAIAPTLIQMGRDEAASELENFASQCKTRAEKVAGQMTECANWTNQGTVETFRQAANIARAGQDYRNPNCTNCGDTRGGAESHLTGQCTWIPPDGLFSERDQCLGMVQVGWMGPYGIVPGGMDNDPVPHWRPIYMKRSGT